MSPPWRKGHFLTLSGVSKSVIALVYNHCLFRLRRRDGLGVCCECVQPTGASLENGFLRLCGACQAIRRLPDTFFPKFINEVVCDEDKASHGKCKQKHMSFTVLRNNGTKECQLWTKFSINVRVSCECFVDERSFFSTYV
ncbi:unnamed protein product [Soboliphyme baturini]|uniref:CTCK domain-containing protein n=1 Tax=Soboliphyme baturini TaxID=241478 RepID=A0A183IQL0_9BILA|nr:unnamed protein product [Soboliphyme baturini]